MKKEQESLQTFSWYSKNNISSIEKKLLPEWFNGSAPHQTPKIYIEIREKIISLSQENENKYVSATAVRRSVPGDVGSLLRLHKFLEACGFINTNSSADFTSLPLGLALPNSYDNSIYIEKGIQLSNPNINNLSQLWSLERQKLLAISMAQHTLKKRKRDSDES